MKKLTQRHKKVSYLVVNATFVDSLHASFSKVCRALKLIWNLFINYAHRESFNKKCIDNAYICKVTTGQLVAFMRDSMLYGLDACPISPTSLDLWIMHAVVSCGRKLFNVNTSVIAAECLLMFGVCDVVEVVARRRHICKEIRAKQ